MEQTLHTKPTPKAVEPILAAPEVGLTQAQVRQRKENALSNGTPISAGRSE